MTGADFNSRIDTATAGGAANGKPYQDMVNQLTAIKKIQADQQKMKQEFASGKTTTTNVGSGQVIESFEGYKDTFKFTDKNFNTATQSTMQMFGVDRTRDGASLNRERSPANNGPQLRQRPQLPSASPAQQGNLGQRI